MLTGGPAAGKTTLISRILKEFKQDEGWKVITIPETATELISGFGIKPFGGCVSMLDFQDFVVSDQLHKEQLALKAAQMVPEEHVIVLYDRALFDDKAYISDEEFRQVLARFGLTEQQALSHYDTVLHLVSCAKGAEFAYNFGNEARYEPLELAREKDDLTLRAWRAHPNLHVIDNSVDFEDKIARGLRAVYEALGRPTQQEVWHKYLIALPTLQTLEQTYHAASIDMMQTYLTRANPNIVRRVRQQKNGGDYLYFYTEKRTTGSGQWETEKPISEKEYIRYLIKYMENNYTQKLSERIEIIREQIIEEAGVDFNISSPKQLGEVLFDRLHLPHGKKTKTGYSTAADVLESLAPEYTIVANVLEYRTLTKLKSTYGEGLVAFIEPDGRMHDGLDDAWNTARLIEKLEKNPNYKLIYRERQEQEDSQPLKVRLGELFEGLNLQLG